MSSSIKKFLNNNWVIALGGGIILIFLTLIITDWYNQNAFSTSFKWVCGKIVILLNLELKLWWFLILLVLAKPLKMAYKRFFTSPLLEPQNETQIPNPFDNIPDETLKRISLEIERDQNYDQIKKGEMLAYTADKFDELIWKWSWKFNPIIKRFEAKNAAPLCPNQKCGNFELDYSGYNDEFGDYLYDCKLCGKNYPSSSHKSDIEKYIENKYKETNV